MLLMTSQATQPFVNTDGGAVVSGTNLHAGERRVALVEKRLAAVRTDPKATLAHTHLGQRQTPHGHRFEFPPIEQRQGRPEGLLGGSRVGRLKIRTNQWQPLTMHLVAGEARNCRLIRQPRVATPPWARGVYRHH